MPQMPPAEFGKLIQRDLAKWVPIVKASGRRSIELARHRQRIWIKFRCSSVRSRSDAAVLESRGEPVPEVRYR